MNAVRFFLRALSISVGLVCTVVMTASTSGQTFLIDDFNDGDDRGWRRNANFPAGGPGNWNASSFEYNLSSTGPVFPANGGLGSEWVESEFSNGYLRAKVRANNETTLALLGLRHDGAGNAYEFLADALGHNFDIFKIGSGGVAEKLAFWEDPSVSFNQGEDWMLEAGAVGDQLSLKFWKDGDPEPAAPQVTVTDTSYAQGTIFIGAIISGRSPTPGIIDATFDDITFTVPEPSTAILSILGVAWMLLTTCHRTRSRE